MNFLKKTDGLDNWLFGDEGRPLAPTAASSTPPKSTPPSPAQRTKLAQAALAIQDKYKKMALNNKNYKAIATTYPIPLSKKFRKYLRDKQRHESTDQKQRRLLQLSHSRSQAPFSLHDIVKDPKKLPHLLEFLSKSDQVNKYHQVLLFLIELETLRTQSQQSQLLKLYNKYFDPKSEFNISPTLELTIELEQLVLASIQNEEVGWLGFRPIQKLAFKRLTREELPRFLKSKE
ncbi:hypothetical protein THRCLA_03778, partial [Thraustotheca clavata]